jgi:hypothetical protein
MASLTGTLTFWLSAFIPKDVPNYTRKMTKGTNSGKTAIPLPSIARLNPGNLFKDLAAGYLTDQRTFNSSKSASARMRSLAEVELSPLKVALTSQTTSGTTEVNIDTGATTDYAMCDMSRCKFGALTLVKKDPLAEAMEAVTGRKPVVARMKLKAAAFDPLVASAADIDYEGTFTITLDHDAGSLTVDFNGKIDDFPAYECYATFNNVTKALFKVPPPAGNTVANLLGGATRATKGSVVFT